MFCTEKERETCDVEKHGCEGCYYNDNKNEFKNLKEIIELVRIEIDEGNENVNATLDYEDLKELFYLLEHYQQEKEKNKKLEEEREEFIKNHIKAVNDEVKRAEWDYEKKKFYEKVIDMMAEDLQNNNWEFGCRYEENAECMKGPARNCENCIKEYYFKKAREE